MSALPLLRYSTAGLPVAQGFVMWRDLMAPQYRVTPAAQTKLMPGGSVNLYLLGDILVNRTIFGTQHVTRDGRMIDSTPDHVALQLWRSGGYRGDVGKTSIILKRGQVALADRRRPLDCRFTQSDTLGFVIPRSLLDGVDLERLTTALDPARSRLAAAQISALYRRMPSTAVAEVPLVTAGLLAFVRRLFDPSPARDVLEGSEFDMGLFRLAERAIARNLGTPDLSPQTLAEQIGTSRATLYRALAPAGGVMGHVWNLRLGAVKAALDDPLETRRLTQLATEHGFKTQAHLSRSFRSRFGMSPREWRDHCSGRVSEVRQVAPDPIQSWWNRLGR